MRKLPDLLCFYRMAISLLLVFFGLRPWVPVLYSVALLSDLFDGFFYRHYTIKDPPSTIWPFSVSPDPIADCLFVTGGLAYLVRYTSSSFRLTMIIAAAFLLCEVILGIVLTSVLRGTIGTIYVTFLTHFACAKMLATTIGVWYLNTSHWGIDAAVTIVLFYGIFLAIGDKSRLVRRR